MNKTQLKEAVKAVVRECLNERVIKEVAPPGDKAERMVQHVKASLRKSHPDWDDEKVASVAIGAAWKAHNKGSVEQDECGMEGGAGEASTSQGSVIDKIVRFVLQKYPSIKANPDKISKAVALLFHRLYNKVASGEEIQQSVERNMGEQDRVADTAVSDTPEKPKASKKPSPAEEGGEEEESKSEPKAEEEEEESKPKEEESYEEDESVNEAAAKTLPPNKGQYKVATARQYTTTDQNKALTIQTDPEVNEDASKTLPPNKGQYKVATPRQYATVDQNKALTIQTDPKVNEAGLTSEKTPDMRLSTMVREGDWIKGAVKHPGRCKHMGSPECPEGSPQYNLAKRFKKGDIHKANVKTENHKVQARSFVTSKDQAQDPNIVRDPEVPGP